MMKIYRKRNSYFRKIKTGVLLTFAFLWGAFNGNAQILDESFEDGSLPAGWSQEYVSDSNDWTFVKQNGNSTITPRTGTYMAEFRNTDEGSATKLITPSMDLTSLTNPTLTFYYANVNWFGDIDELRVYYKTSAGDSWTMIPGMEFTAEKDAWEKVEVVLPNPSSDYYIAFEATSEYARGLNLDDVSVDELPTCFIPSNLSSSNTTTSSVDLSWTENNTATAWTIKYNEGTDFDPLTNGTAVNTSSNPYTLSGLSDNTTYYVYVKSNCDPGNDESNWAGPYSFSTLCNATNVPYFEDFETATPPNIPNCTSVEQAGAGNVWFTYNNPNNEFTSTTLVYQWHDFNPGNTWFYTQGLNLETGKTYELSYTYGSEDSYYVEKMKVAFGTSPNSSAMTTLIADHSAINQGIAQNTTTYFTPLSTGVYYIGFQAYSDPDKYALYLDDISVNESLICAPPTIFLSSNVTTTSVELSWTENNSATAWTIKYNEGTDFDPLTSGTSISVSSNPYTLTGLNDNTTYYVYVKSNCAPGNDESAWTGPISFATPCSPGTVPFFEGFENGFAHGTPVAGCWSQESEAGAKVWMANNTLTNYNRSPRSGSWNAYLEYNNSDWMFYDLQLELGKTYQLEFYARQDETSGATIGAAFGTAASSASMTNIIIPNSAVTNGNYQKFEGTFTPTTSGVYYIGIYGETNFDPWYISIDDISIYELVQCSGVPNAGTTADMAVCENQDFTITATGAVTTEENLTGRWDYSTDQINWTAIPNSFNKTYTVVGGVSEETYFRFVATCNGADSTHSNVMTVSLKTANECYCEPLAVPGCVDADDDINDFELIGENGTQISDMGTGCTSSSYLDQTTSFAPVDLYTDQTYTGLITTNSYLGDVSAAIWIDFNDDGVFSPSELVGGGLDVDWYEEYSITIPSDAQLGTHRMRIVLDYDLYGDIASFDPCETVYGEVHDYMVNIICNPTNFVNLGADDAYCVGDFYSKNLDAGNAGATYLWPDGSTNQVLEVTTAGKYYVDVTRSNGCSASDTVVIVENALPIVDLGADDDYCIGTPYSKTLDAGNTGATYLWSDGSTDQTLEVTTAGTYYVDVKDNNGCSSSDTVVIVENALPTVDLGPDGILCAGSTVTLDAGVVDSYLWSDGSIGQTLEVTTSGKYYVDVTNAAGCSASDTVEITIHTMPVVALGGDQTICDGTITLDAGNAGATYAWSNGDTTQIVTVNTSGTYSVEVDNNGCIAVDTVVITISDEPEAGNITATNSGCDFDFGITNTANATSYDWDFGDGKTETTTTAYTSHTYAEEGVYTVKVTAKNDCGQITKEVDVSCIEGSVEDIAANRVAMYPNPTSSVVTLEATVDMTTITIIDNVGKVVYQTSPNHTMNYQMNVSELSNGFYTIIITTDSGVITKKLEVMKY